MNQPNRVIAGIIGLTGFAVAALSGLAAANPAEQVLGRAIAAMLVLYVVGLPIGAAMCRVARDSVAEYKRKNPLPEVPGGPVLVVSPTDSGHGGGGDRGRNV